MKKSLIIMIGMLVFAYSMYAQEEPTEPAETADPTVEEPLTANASEQERISRLAEASGMTEAEISDMRNGVAVEGTETEGVKKTGWGRIAQMLGLHPGVLGHGTGEKFMPELPEADRDAMDAAVTARERAMERKAERHEVKTEAKQSRRDRKAEKVRGKPDKDPKAVKKEKPANANSRGGKKK